MSVPVLIIGKSGSGKSASLRNFKENLGVINVLGKPFPFKGQPASVNTKNYNDIKKVIAMSKAKAVVIDDAGYLITDHFMTNHAKTGGGNAVFSLYNDIGDYFYSLIKYITELEEPDKIVYIFMHEDKNDFGDVRPKTIGKLLDEKVCLEGLFSIVLRCVSDKEKHVFCTQSNGLDVAKTPIGMFEDFEIPNDLQFVDKTIREYYGFEQTPETPKIPQTQKKADVPA